MRSAKQYKSTTEKLLSYASMLLIITALSVLFLPSYAQQPQSAAAPGDGGTDEGAGPITPDEDGFVGEDQCLQAWPVSCEEGAEGTAGCGGWNILKNLAESEQLPYHSQPTCSTGVRIALNDTERTQGQPVGAMFPGTVTFAQSGISRDGQDYGGVVVIKLNLTDGSPQCYLRYMFLDRRDLPVVGEEIKAGQRVGSIASDDMDINNNWWAVNWPGWQPQLKVDIGCDEALLNLPHFMPKQPMGDYGTTDPQHGHTCSLTKMRFPSPPLEYLISTEWGGNVQCDVGVRPDARYPSWDAQYQDDSERQATLDTNHVAGAKPQDALKRKKTPVMSFFGKEDDAVKTKLEETLYGANHRRSGQSQLFRDHNNYRNATILQCVEMEEIFSGRRTTAGSLRSLTPNEVRELLAFCTNQHILGRAMFPKVYDATTTNALAPSTAAIRDNPQASPIAPIHLSMLTEAERTQYNDLVNNGATRQDIIDEMGDVVRRFSWRDQCQPLTMQPIIDKDYNVNDILQKAWQETLIDWPQNIFNEEGERNLDPIPGREMSIVDLNDYTEYPYERINDPSHPFSPRHIFRETERERYSNYGVQCAATPVDLILGEYMIGDNLRTYGRRATTFHQCISCRIKLNQTPVSFTDPYSYQNAGGCDNASGTYASGELCPSFSDLSGNPIPGFLEYLYDLEDRYGLARGMLHATATVESGCRACPSPSDNCRTGNAFNAKGMFQMVYPGEWGVSNPYDPHDAAEGAAKYHATYADQPPRFPNDGQQARCDLGSTICAYNCGPGCRNCGNSQTSKYLQRFQGWGIQSACSASGSFPNGDGAGSGPSLGSGDPDSDSDGDDDSEGTGLDDVANVFSSGSGGPMTGVGNFNPADCPIDYFTTTFNGEGPPSEAVRRLSEFPDSAISTSPEEEDDTGSPPASTADQACAPFSNPTPEVPVPGAGPGELWRDWCHTDGADYTASNGCFERNHWTASGAWGCWRTEQGSAGSSTWPKCDLMSPEHNGTIWCAGGVCENARLHEGVDVAFELGAPIYAAGNGRVTKSTWMVSVDHSGYCIHDPIGTPGCVQYPQGMRTNYLHMGSERILDNITVGAEVSRCQQIGTVGTVLSNGGTTVPHLHFETIYPNNTVTGPSFGGQYTNNKSYWPYDPRETYHVHPTDKSCSGGISDPDGLLGSAAGICRFALPLDKYHYVGDPPRRELKTDLDQPEYLTDAEAGKNVLPLHMRDVEMPDPPSEGLNDPNRSAYDVDVKGMIFNGIWVECDSFTTQAEVDFCNDWGEAFGSAQGSGDEAEEEEEEEAPAAEEDGFIRPVPCHPGRGSYGIRAPIPSLCPQSSRYCGPHLHAGEDISAPTGTPILAAASGIVDGTSGSGISREISHPQNGTRTRYMHMSAACVNVGDSVQQGQVIGFVGSTGFSTGPHLHFEIRTPAPVNPIEHIPEHQAGSPACAIINNAQCGDIITDLATGAGVSGATTKKIEVEQACSVRYDLSDTTSGCAFPYENDGCTPLGNFNQRGEGGGGQCCYNITKPVASLNILKLRPGYDNEVAAAYNSEYMSYNSDNENGRFTTFPRETRTRNVEHPILDLKRARYNEQQPPVTTEGAWDGTRLIEEGGQDEYSHTNRGAPEGYTFFENFRNHRPFMRWWDTGAESHHIYMEQVDTQSDAGKFDAIVGVGTEHNSCGYGGWGEPLAPAPRRCTWRDGCVPGGLESGLPQPDTLDGNTSWLELKLYQARATYQHSLHCIPKYEMEAKPFAAEDYVLHLAGGSFSTNLGRTGTIEIGFPLGWRGYVSEPSDPNGTDLNSALRFPYLANYPYTNFDIEGMNTSSMSSNLDYALPGDILIWDEKVITDEETGQMIRLPHVAFVTSADNAAMREQSDRNDSTANSPENVDIRLRKERFFAGGIERDPFDTLSVTEYNYGRYPDTCGGTNWQGVGPERKLYKQGLPDDSRNRLETFMGVNRNLQDCSNPDLSSCHETLWDRVKIYRPWKDVRD